MVTRIKYFNFFICIVLAGLLSSCGLFNRSPKQDADVSAPMLKGEAGMHYQMHHDAPGDNLKPGDIVRMHIVMTNSTDSVLTDTYAYGEPVEFQFAEGPVKGSFEDALSLLSVGDSATVFVNSDTLFARANLDRPMYIEKGSDLEYTVKVLKSMTMAQYAEEQEEIARKAKKKEMEKIEAYIKNNGLDADKMEDGPWVVMTESNESGKVLEKGDDVKIHYRGYLLDGSEFDNSYDRGQPIAIQLGAGQVIRGWDEGLVGLRVGEKATLIIPSEMAYGQSGRPGIPPNSTLIFDLEVVDADE